MIYIKVTISIVKLGKGSYVARVDEFPITAEPAATQRGAIKKLKAAALDYLRKKTAEGTLNTVLGRAGYNPELMSFPGATIRPFVIDTLDVSVSLPHRRSRLPAAYRRKERHVGLVSS